MGTNNVARGERQPGPTTVKELQLEGPDANAFHGELRGFFQTRLGLPDARVSRRLWQIEGEGRPHLARVIGLLATSRKGWAVLDYVGQDGASTIAFAAHGPNAPQVEQLRGEFARDTNDLLEGLGSPMRLPVQEP